MVTKSYSGARPARSSSGRSGAAFCPQPDQPDFVIPPQADLLLVEPESTIGLEHARLVRAYFPDLPVLCLNALPEAGSFLTKGPVAFLQKPFTVDVMRTTVRFAHWSST